MNDQDLLRYSRHILMDEIGIAGQESLLAATALVIGCGGLGAHALPLLAAAGVGRLIIVDGDTVDSSNLQRQTAFSEADIACLKTEAMTRRLQALNHRCVIDARPQHLDEAAITALAAQADVLLDCSDNFATRQAINRASVATGTPLVSGAAVRFEGQVAVYNPKLPESPCYACVFDGATANDGACATFGVFGPLVGIIGSTQAAMALKLLMGIGSDNSGQLASYDALSGQWQYFRCPRDPHCRVCAAATP